MAQNHPRMNLETVFSDNLFTGHFLATSITALDEWVEFYYSALDAFDYAFQETFVRFPITSLPLNA